jgi:hypothetical protein
MRSGALQAYCVAAAVVSCGTGVLAQTVEEAAPAPPASELSGGAKPEHFLFYSGFDIWRFGRASYGGFYAAPEGLNTDGFIVRLFVSGGRERYDAGSKRFDTDIFRGSLAPGWRLSEGSFEVKLFAGLELENRTLMPALPAPASSNTHIGARVVAETWWEPGPEIMLASSLSATTNANAWSVRGAAGWRAFEQVWGGPEILASGDAYSKQYRIGAHLTGLRLSVFEWSLAAGYVQDSFHRSGIYGRIGILTRQ